MLEMKLRGKVIEGQQVTVGDRDLHCHLGPHLTLRRCDVIFTAPAKAIRFVGPCDFVDCKVEAKQKLVNFQDWAYVALRGCTLKGSFKGNDFGHRDNAFDLDGTPIDYGRVEDCDFTLAQLDACRFFNTDMARVKLPGWPWFTVLDPARVRRILATTKWPGNGRVFADLLAEESEDVSASVDHAPTVCKVLRITESDLKATLQQVRRT